MPWCARACVRSTPGQDRCARVLGEKLRDAGLSADSVDDFIRELWDSYVPRAERCIPCESGQLWRTRLLLLLNLLQNPPPKSLRSRLKARVSIRMPMENLLTPLLRRPSSARKAFAMQRALAEALVVLLRDAGIEVVTDAA